MYVKLFQRGFYMNRKNTAAIVLVFVLLTVCGCRTSSRHDSTLFSTEVIEGVKYIHNYGAQRGEDPGVRLEYLGTIGKSNSSDERYILFDPMDAVRLDNGDILVLEGRGCLVKRFSRDYKFLSSFGQKGSGPGDFVSPFSLCLDPKGESLFVADLHISRFTVEGDFRSSFKPERIGGSSIHEQFRTAGAVALSDQSVILPSHPSLWMESGKTV